MQEEGKSKVEQRHNYHVKKQQGQRYRTVHRGAYSSRHRRRRRDQRKLLLIFGVLAAIVLVISAILLVPFFQVKHKVTLEAGEELPEVSELLRWGGDDAEIVSGADTVDLHKVGDYELTVRVGKRKIKCTLSVKDTVAPKVSAQDQSAWVGDEISADRFLASVEDATSTTAAFVQEPDLGKAGTQTVKIRVTDEGGNTVETEAQLTVMEDTEPPVISGVKDLTVAVGGSISYKKDVTVTDNRDENVELTVDNSAVNLNEKGSYPVTYKAVDAAGNEATVTATVYVKAASVETATEDMVNAKADEILATIIDDSMSEYDKAKAIFWWCHEKIGYYDGTPKTNWVQGAYRGLVERRGDCYVYAMTAKCLLTRAGIKNMDIEKIPAKTMHYWNLVDLGEGWYHFDTCRRADGSYFFYATDEELMAYSKAHHNSHNYDPSKYPQIQ